MDFFSRCSENSSPRLLFLQTGSLAQTRDFGNFGGFDFKDPKAPFPKSKKGEGDLSVIFFFWGGLFVLFLVLPFLDGWVPCLVP